MKLVQVIYIIKDNIFSKYSAWFGGLVSKPRPFLTSHPNVINLKLPWWLCSYRSSPSELFLGKGVLKICSKFTGEHPCRSAISIKLQRCSPVNLLHIFRTPFPKNTYGWLLLEEFLYLITLYKQKFLIQPKIFNSKRHFWNELWLKYQMSYPK